ncbi:MAG: exo-beta-N-acetylmuramidase NamZ family protein [Pyrinomonadaceae bacterium]
MARLQHKAVKLGLEKILDKHVNLLKGLRVGLVCNPASVNHQFQHAADLFYQNEHINLTTLFGPQHGIRGDVQDNMIETGHIIDSQTEIPIYSLYSETRQPSKEMLSGVDALVFDLQDVGCRVYTFIYTMANCMRACAEDGKKMFVLDRPNPINGLDIEGNLLETGHESFVGMYPIPMRHGMTVGELAKLFNNDFELHCDLEIITMDGWSREDYYDETDAPWVMPSPNMPAVDTSVVFPATVYFEGTQVSEGRGTTRPFEIVGASYINSYEYADALTSLDLSGVIFRPINFLPTFQKFANESCGGVFLHITDRRVFEPVITGLAMIKTIFDLYPNDFKWKNPPYEYVFDRYPFDVIAGTTKIREYFDQGKTISEIKKFWEEDIKAFYEIREKYLLY